MKIPGESFIAAINTTTDIIFFTDKEGNIFYVNPAFEKITGYTADEVMGKNPRIWKSGEHPKEFYKNLWDTILSGKPYRAVLKNKKKDGSIYYEEKTITPVKDKEVTHFISSGKDITERVQYELKLERSNKELETYSRIVAHDLRNPLSVIALSTDLLEQIQSNSLTGETGKLFKKIKKNIKWMEALIKDLLEYGRIGHDDELPEKVNLNELVYDLINQAIASSDKKIKISIKTDLPTIIINKLHITQVFQNLISNAVKFMDKEIGKVEIGFEEQKDKWIFYVMDNGPGIERKYLDKLFQPFQKAHTRKDVQSTGIGLSIVRKIIEKLGGKIWIDTEFGKSSKFTFFIPK